MVAALSVGAVLAIGPGPLHEWSHVVLGPESLRGFAGPTNQLVRRKPTRTVPSDTRLIVDSRDPLFPTFGVVTYLNETDLGEARHGFSNWPADAYGSTSVQLTALFSAFGVQGKQVRELFEISTPQELR
jgi:hypothetical protein